MFGLTFNNIWLDQQDRTAEKHKIIRIASIYGGASAY
jgi:hypothetical protein